MVFGFQQHDTPRITEKHHNQLNSQQQRFVPLPGPGWHYSVLVPFTYLSSITPLSTNPPPISKSYPKNLTRIISNWPTVSPDPKSRHSHTQHGNGHYYPESILPMSNPDLCPLAPALMFAPSWKMDGFRATFQPQMQWLLRESPPEMTRMMGD